MAAAATLAVIVATLGVAIVQFVPIGMLRLVIGVLLLLFGLKWLKNSILRYSGLKALHDEEAIFEERRLRYCLAFLGCISPGVSSALLASLCDYDHVA